MQVVDLSGHRLVTIEEVAIIFGISPAAVRQKLHYGRFPITPKTKKPFKWASTELRAWFENDKKRAL